MLQNTYFQYTELTNEQKKNKLLWFNFYKSCHIADFRAMRLSEKKINKKFEK